jgi:hypothetical protein
MTNQHDEVKSNTDSEPVDGSGVDAFVNARIGEGSGLLAAGKLK